MKRSNVLALVAGGSMLAAGAAHAADAPPWRLQRAIGAPEGLTVSGSVRFRYEAIDGQPRPGFASSEDYLAMRTTLFAEYRTGPVRFGGEIYDSRVYGEDAPTSIGANEVNAFEPVQAYVGAELGPLFGPGSKASVQLGRMTLNLGSRRLVAADDFRNTINSVTGAKVDTELRGGLSATLIYVTPVLRLPDDLPSIRRNEAVLDKETDDAWLWGGVVTKTGLPARSSLDLQYFGFDERDAPGRPTRNRNLHTYGVRIFRIPAAGKLDYEVEVDHQSGTVRSGAGAAAPLLEVSASFVHAEAGWTFAGAWKPHLVVEYDWVEGDHDGGRYNRFDTLLGMRRADFSPAGLLSAIGRANIETAGVRLEVTPSPRWDAFIHYNPMWLASRTDSFSTTGVRDASGRSGGFAGHELDGRFRYWIVPQGLRLEANAVWIAKGRFLEQAPNAPRNGDTLYAALSLQAQF